MQKNLKVQNKQQPEQTYNELNETGANESQRDNTNLDITVHSPTSTTIALVKTSKSKTKGIILCVFISFLLIGVGLGVFLKSKEISEFLFKKSTGDLPITSATGNSTISTEGSSKGSTDTTDDTQSKGTSEFTDTGFIGGSTKGTSKPKPPSSKDETPAEAPTQPTKPSQPTEVTQPEKPTEATKPTEPIKVTDPIEPTKPAEVTQPTKPTEPTKPVEVTQPTKPTEPAQPVETPKEGPTAPSETPKTEETPKEQPKSEPVVTPAPLPITDTVLPQNYSLPKNFANTYTDLTQLKGKHKEAYAFLFCTPTDADDFLKGNWFGVRTHIGKLANDSQLEQRDVVIMACPFVPKWQLDILQKTGAIVAIVELISTTRPVYFGNWKTVFTKLHAYQLINWDRVLFMDIDILPMKGFYDIWEEPATKLVTEPPPGTDMNATWFGQKVKDLYPYIQSGAFDTWILDWSTKNTYLNGGFYIMKPSLPHWYALMNLTYDYSIELDAMDQKAVNIVYKRSGPVPWHDFSIYYDYSPLNNPIRPEVKAYHVRCWTPRDGKRDGWMGTLFLDFWERYDAMIEVSYNITITPEPVDLTIKDTSVTVHNLKLSSDAGMLYYWATLDQIIQPTHEQIKEKALENKNQGLSISSTAEVSFTVDNLQPNQMYNIFYFAETTNKFNTKTNVYYVSIRTKQATI